VDSHIRISLETITDSYLHTLVYRPADDLVALVRCWKLATQFPSYKALKEWGALASDHHQMRNVIRAYWRRQHDELERRAERCDYANLRAYFSNPSYIEPVPQEWTDEEQAQSDESGADLVYGDDEKGRDVENFLLRNSSTA